MTWYYILFNDYCLWYIKMLMYLNYIMFMG